MKYYKTFKFLHRQASATLYQSEKAEYKILHIQYDLSNIGKMHRKLLQGNMSKCYHWLPLHGVIF